MRLYTIQLQIFFSNDCSWVQRTSHIPATRQNEAGTVLSGLVLPGALQRVEQDPVRVDGHSDRHDMNEILTALISGQSPGQGQSQGGLF